MKIFVSTAEVSGDLHAAQLVEEIKKIIPQASFWGIGGDLLKKAGVNLIAQTSTCGSVGLVEALYHLPYLFLAGQRAAKFLKKEKPALLILVDSQGLNLPLAKKAKALGIKTVYYIAPQEWLWGTSQGMKNVADTIDLILAIFKKEYERYQAINAQVVYHGHPLLDIAKTDKNKEDFLKEHHLDPRYPIIGLFPGNRRQETKYVLPVMLKAAALIKESAPACQFVLPIFTKEQGEKVLLQVKKSNLEIKIIQKQNYDLLQNATLVLSTPGTVTLEAAIFKVPALCIYKLHPFTYFIANHFLKIRMPYFSMPSLLLEKEVVPEFIQQNARPELVAEKALSLLHQEDELSRYKGWMSQVRSQLEPYGSIKENARAILKAVV